MRFVTSIVVALVFALLSVSVLAIDTQNAFDDPELQARYERIIAEVRCLKCQNQSIKDSNAVLAADLRREIQRMISDGMSDDQIYDFLVERYGDFALYRPRASGKTLLLWIAPAALLVGGALFLVQVVRRRMRMPVDLDEDATENKA